jgi:dolichol-phosphate mannosyltransferase
MNVRAVIPTYNERENVGQLIPRLFSAVPQIEVLIVDDNSPDGTGDAVREMQLAFPNLSLLSREKERGFGSAYLAGFRRILESREEGAILMLDADLSHDPAYVPVMLEKLQVCDAVIGSRYAPGGGVEGWELWRRALSRAGNAYIRLVTGMSFADCSSGFNLIRTEVLRRLNLSATSSAGYAFLMELKYRLWREGARMEEVPIHFHNRIHGESKISARIIREGIRAPWLVRFKGARR